MNICLPSNLQRLETTARALFALCLVAFMVAVSSPVHAQDLPDVAQGLQPYVGYHGGDLDQISTLNGSLTVRIPLVSYPQKGSLALSYSVIFNSFNFQDFSTCITVPPGGEGPPLHSGCTDNIQPMPTGVGVPIPGPRFILDQSLYAGGIAMPIPTQASQYNPDLYGRFYVITADNAQHPLAPVASGYRSTDESGYLFVPSSPPALGTNLGSYNNAYNPPVSTMGGAAGTITDSHGIVYTSTSITDPDGNTILLGATPSSPTIDSTGRQIYPPSSGNTANCPVISSTLYPLISLQPLVSAQLWTPPGSGSGYLFCYATVNINTHIGTIPRGNGSSQYSGAFRMLQSIVLPNGQWWGFVYDSVDPNSDQTPTQSNANTGTGQLLSLIYPTGGSVNYSYTLQPGFCNFARPNLGTNPDGVGIVAYPNGVYQRTKKDASGNTLGVWTYGQSTGGGWAEVVSPSNSLTTHSYVQDPNNPNNNCSFFDAGQTVYAGPTATGTPLVSTVKTYTFANDTGTPYASAPRESQTTTTLASGKSMTIQKSYSSPGTTFFALICDYTGNNCTNGNSFTNPVGGPTSTTYIGYDGTTIKQENTTYQWQANSAYLNANLIDIPSSQSITDGSSNVYSQTNYSYDEAAYSSGSVRGHATTVQTVLSGSASSPTTHTGWNSSGMKSYVIDADANANVAGHTNANGHTFDYNYGGNSCGGSLVDSTTNALGQTVSGTYDCNTGLLTSLTDANSNTTQVSWDTMRRPTQFTYPAIPAGTPTTTFSYNDATNTVTRTTLASPDPTQTLAVSFDGFGREIHRVTSDSPQNDTVDTTYDANGRVSSVSNPYRSTSDGTYGITTYTYDALNRKTVVTHPDGAQIVTCYDGVAGAGQTSCPTNASAYPNVSFTDTEDEAGYHTQHLSDALGRLIAVEEVGNGSGTALATSYTYDPLGNLTSVDQAGTSGDTARTRNFTYDSLSRLLTSQNPETGTITYAYDANSNLKSKTDAIGNTTTLTYDGLNRLLSKTYSGPYASVTNSVGFGYDGKDSSGNTLAQQPSNTIGRMSYWTAGTNNSQIFSYDPMGRLSWQSYCVPSNCFNGIWANADYDLAGNIIGIRYPDGRGETRLYDAVGRLGSSIITWPFSDDQGLESWTLYNPDNTVSIGMLGNGVYRYIGETNRLQPGVRVLATIGGSGSALPGGTQLASHVYCYWTPCVPGASGNNGTIWGIIDANGGTTAQWFSYDNLNRINQFWWSQGNQALTQTYATDHFGNMSLMSGNSPLFTFNTSSNRPDQTPCQGVQLANAFDANGNQLCTMENGGPLNLVYDAENRIAATYSQGSNANSPAETYTYGADGARVQKLNTASGDYTEYINFQGKTIAELDKNGNYTDYAYGPDGERIAVIPGTDSRLHTQGTSLSGRGSQWNLPVPQNPDGTPYTIRNGDQLCFRQYNLNAVGGVALQYPDGTTTLGRLNDQTGIPLGQASTGSTWMNRCADISMGGAEQVQPTWLAVVTDPSTPQGSWNIWYGDMSITSTNGTVTQINLAAASLAPLNASQLAQVSSAVWETVSETNDPTSAQIAATHYLFTDHLGSSQMEFSQGGWPVASKQFGPYGAELNSQTTLDHYKFTGKERDAESGLDYFGARYNSSSMGRFMSPDPSGLVYADPSNPQTLNLYAYVSNNPLSNVDPDGLSWFTQPCTSDGPATGAEDSATSLGTRIKNFFGNLFCGGGGGESGTTLSTGGGQTDMFGRPIQQQLTNSQLNQRISQLTSHIKHTACDKDFKSVGKQLGIPYSAKTFSAAIGPNIQQFPSRDFGGAYAQAADPPFSGGSGAGNTNPIKLYQEFYFQSPDQQGGHLAHEEVHNFFNITDYGYQSPDGNGLDTTFGQYGYKSQEGNTAVFSSWLMNGCPTT